MPSAQDKTEYGRQGRAKGVLLMMNKLRMTNSSLSFTIMVYTILGLLSLCFIFPFIMVISTSLLSQEAVLKYGTFQVIPKTFDITAYKLVLGQGSGIYRAYGITIFRVVVGTFLSLMVTAALAYGLSKKFLPGRNVFITLIFITMVFSGGLIPTYMTVKSLGLIDTVWAMIIPHLVSSTYFIVLKAFFNQIPEGIEESASIDGANPFQVLVYIVVPLSLPSIATIGLFYGVWHWNDWFYAAIYLNDYKIMPVQILLRDAIILLSGEKFGLTMTVVDKSVRRPPSIAFKSAIIIITTIPILFVYPFIQKYFVKGALIGSIKG